MKNKLFAWMAMVAVVCLLAGVSAFASGEPSQEAVDAYTSASATRTPLTGDALDAAVEELSGLCSDLSTSAEAAAPGYTAPQSKTALILSVNPDGSPGMSTIEAWHIEQDADGVFVTVVMTDGQNIRNLCEAGDKGTLIVHGSQYYILHLETEDVICLEYSDEAYAAGLFNHAYSGASEQRCEYTVTFRVYAAEGSYAYMFE